MIFLNGRLTTSVEARIDPADRGFLLGDGVFETLSCLAGRPVFLDRHLKRLTDGADALGIPPLLGADRIAEAVLETLAASDLARSDAVVRITLTRGPGPRGLRSPDDPRPTLMITAGATHQTEVLPASVVIASVRRNEHSPTSRLKTLNYLDNILARREAEARGAGEALMRNTAGDLCCASAANLFVVNSGTLMTPPPEAGVLPGITRAAIKELAQSLGIAFLEKAPNLDDLRDSSEIFLSNSLVGIQAIKAVADGRDWPETPGEVTRRLQKAYGELIRDQVDRG